MANYLPMKELFERIRDHSVRRALIPMECRLSWLIPVKHGEDDKLYLDAFFYPVTGRADEQAKVGRPCFHITVDASTGRVVELTDCSFIDFASAVSSKPTLGVLSAHDLPAKTIPELQQKREEMFEACDRVLPCVFKPMDTLTLEERKDLGHFHRLLESMMEPMLREFYRALNPRFFEWLSTVEE